MDEPMDFPARLLLLFILIQATQGQSNPSRLALTRSPAAISSYKNATFEFIFSGDNECSTKCSIRCQLDGGPFQDCSAGRISYSGLSDGDHTFEVSVVASAASSQHFTAKRSWTIDTVPPTASVVPRTSFTDGSIVTVDVKFSEPCSGEEFSCSNHSSCDLIVRGSGAVLPATLQVIQSGVVYSLQIALSNNTVKGRVVLAVSRMGCTDAAGNKFQRTINSTAIVRFDRSQVFVNVWTPIADSQVLINSRARTVQATNKVDDLKVYLDFTEPVVNATEELLQSLHSTVGVLRQTRRKSRGNRRFAFSLTDVPSPGVVTVSFNSSRIMSRAGSFVQPVSPVSFIFDRVRPQARVSTSIRTKTKDRLVPLLVRFSEPVFQFTSSGITVAGGRVARFKQVSTSTYFVQLSVTRGQAVSVFVPQNQTADVAGNTNEASNVLQFKHYQVPPLSVAMYIFSTAGMLVTTLASGAISMSAASLAAAGALTSKTVGTIVTDPSRNLLGMVGHLQVFAFTDWLTVDLPTDYRETVGGLRWIIPHVQVTWESDKGSPENSIISDSTSSSIIKQRWPRSFSTDNIQLPRRELGANGSSFGPPLDSTEYQRYFENQTNIRQSLGDIINDQYSGWKDFRMNMFWLAAAVVFLVLLHIAILLVLRWRTDSSVRGALTVPRFELFILMFSLPCVSQASAFIIRGGTTLGIVVGVLFLALPAGFIFCLFIFLLVGVIFGGVVQYKEIKITSRSVSCFKNTLATLVGKRTIAKWVRKEGLSTAFLPRYGLVFEDRKGPPKIVQVDDQDVQRWVDSGANGIGRMKAVNSDEENEPVSRFRKILGAAQVLYILVDITRRASFGIVFGSYATSKHATSQIIILLAASSFQLVYLLLCKPYIRRGVQAVETISLACEIGVFAAALVLLHRSAPSEDKLIGILLIALLLVSFSAQLVNEWYALIGLLLRLSPSDDDQPLKLGLKMFGRGLVLLFVPKSRWPRFTTPQQQEPQTGLTHHVASASPDFQTARQQQPTYETGSPSLTKPTAPGEEEEDEAAKTPGKQKQSWNEWARSWASSAERKKTAADHEMTMLQELAKASFTGSKTQVIASSPASPGTGNSPDRGKQKAIEERQDQSSEDSSNSSVSLTAGLAPSSSNKLFTEPQEALVLRRAGSSGRTLDDR